MSESPNTQPVLVEKEIIPQLSFKNKTKVKQEDDLMKNLLKATTLGNIHHSKVTIIFEDDESLKKVETTIWYTGEEYICLKGGTLLPVNRIHKVII